MYSGTKQTDESKIYDVTRKTKSTLELDYPKISQKNDVFMEYIVYTGAQRPTTCYNTTVGTIDGT